MCALNVCRGVTLVWSLCITRSTTTASIAFMSLINKTVLKEGACQIVKVRNFQLFFGCGMGIGIMPIPIPNTKGWITNYKCESCAIHNIKRTFYWTIELFRIINFWIFKIVVRLMTPEKVSKTTFLRPPCSCSDTLVLYGGGGTMNEGLFVHCTTSPI